jgi:type I phosphodiesterase/nucleotide pyrophosphatase
MPAGKSALRPPRARTTLPRLMVNATLAGVWAAALVVLLIFFLNPGVRLTPRTFLPLAWSLVTALALISGVLWALGAGLVRVFVTFRVRVPWIGFRPFWRFLVVDLCLVAGLYAWNLAEAQEYLPAGMLRRLEGATALLVIGSVLLAGDVVWRGATRRRLRVLAVVAAGILITGGVFGIRQRYRVAELPASASEIEPPTPSAGILLLGIEGASADDLLPMAAGGSLPRFRALLEKGTSAPLHSPRPARQAAAWVTLLTGRVPESHGITDGDEFTPPSGEPVFRLAPAGLGFRRLAALGLVTFRPMKGPAPPVTSLDAILGRCGFEVVRAGWGNLLPQPQREVAVAPRDVSAGRLPDLPAAVKVAVDDLRRHIDAARRDPLGEPLAATLEAALARDLAAALGALSPPAATEGRARALLVRLRGLDAVDHVFLRYLHPEPFGNVTDEEIESYGRVIPDYYRFLDAWLGVLADAAGPDAMVVVTGPYGVRPVTMPVRIVNALTGSGRLSGSHGGAVPGVLLAAGGPIRAGARMERARPADLVPTLLFLLDLPVGRDMEGEALTAFATDEFSARHALTAVPSWETVTVVRP